MPEASDQDNLEALYQGTDAGFAWLYDQYAALMYHIALSLTGSQAVAEDAIQEVFLDLAQRPESLRKVKNLKAYLVSATRHSAWRQRSKWDKTTALQNDQLEQLESPEPQETSEPIEMMLQRLPLEQREVLLLKIDGEMSFEEIGESLKISPNTAASRYRYAMEKLRSWMT